MNRSESLKELAAALSKAQAQMKPAPRDAENPHFRSRYADLASVWDACRGALTENGLSVLQMPSADGNAVTVTTTVLHISGEWVSEPLTLAAKDASPQSVGSAITYARRYGLASAVGVCPHDDDGEAATDHHAPPAARRPLAPTDPPRPPRPVQGPVGAAGNGHTNPPRTGKALFAWTKDMERRLDVKLLGFLNAFGKGQGWPERMTEWPPSDVARAHSEAMRKLGTLRSPDEIGDEETAMSNAREPGQEG
jgi:hypothetical protein